MLSQNLDSSDLSPAIKELVAVSHELGAQELATALSETHVVLLVRKDVRLGDLLRQAMSLGLFVEAITYQDKLPCIELTRRTPHD